MSLIAHHAGAGGCCGAERQRLIDETKSGFWAWHLRRRGGARIGSRTLGRSSYLTWMEVENWRGLAKFLMTSEFPRRDSLDTIISVMDLQGCFCQSSYVLTYSGSIQCSYIMHAHLDAATMPPRLE